MHIGNCVYTTVYSSINIRKWNNQKCCRLFVQNHHLTCFLTLWYCFYVLMRRENAAFFFLHFSFNVGSFTHINQFSIYYVDKCPYFHSKDIIKQELAIKTVVLYEKLNKWNEPIFIICRIYGNNFFRTSMRISYE